MTSDDTVELLRAWCEAYPEDVFPTPPEDKRAKDAAAADVMRTMALPMFARCADEIAELRAALDDARYCISKHQGGCILGCWEATEVAPDDQ